MKTLKPYYALTDKGRKANPTAQANQACWAVIRPLLLSGEPVAASDLITACRNHDHPRGAVAFISYIADDLGWIEPSRHLKIVKCVNM